MKRPYEYEEKDEWGRSLLPEIPEIERVDDYIVGLEDPKDKYAASVTQRLAIVVSLHEAIANGLEHVIPMLREDGLTVDIDGMFVTMLGDCRKEVKKTEELMELWATAYGQEN